MNINIGVIVSISVLSSVGYYLYISFFSRKKGDIIVGKDISNRKTGDIDGNAGVINLGDDNESLNLPANQK